MNKNFGINIISNVYTSFFLNFRAIRSEKSIWQKEWRSKKATLINANVQDVLYSYQMNFDYDGDDTDERSFFVLLKYENPYEN